MGSVALARNSGALYSGNIKEHTNLPKEKIGGAGDTTPSSPNMATPLIRNLAEGRGIYFLPLGRA